MAARLVLTLESCDDPALVGGKGAGLGRLIRSGFPVPPGLCVTTQAYRDGLRTGGIDDAARWARLGRASETHRATLLEETRRLITALSLPQPFLDLIGQGLDRLGLGRDTILAVRSSAFDEDGAHATFAGIYRTRLGVSRDMLAPALLECWASLWTEAALAYRSRVGRAGVEPAMAVILQPLLSPRAAGVAYSRHPLTGEQTQVLINAVFGLAQPLVAGTVTPDHYLVEVSDPPRPARVLERQIAEKTVARTITEAGLRDGPVAQADRSKPVLEEGATLALARLVKNVERAMALPVDVEWALDDRGTWLLQVRPIPEPTRATAPRRLVWSRANFKETLPEVPSPLGLSFLDAFMESNIVSHYRELGCRIPEGWRSVRIMRGRPYINVSLFQSFMAQLGGDPRLVVEHMGGEDRPLIEGPGRLPWWKVLRAGLLMERKIRRAAKRAPAWFAEMRQMATEPSDKQAPPASPAERLARLDRLNEQLRAGDLTLAIVAGVSQSLYALGLLLPRRLGPDWRPVLNGALRGVGTIISAKQILWLAELADRARLEPVAREFLLAEPWEPLAFRSKLAGTGFLHDFDAYLAEYGHRAVGESDPMAARFAEMPDYLLGVVRGHLQGPAALSKSAEDIQREQESVRTHARRQIRAAFGWRRHEWLLFRHTYNRLCRFLALREANRHYLMYFAAAARRIELQLGDAFVASGRLRSRDDIFFLTADEIRSAVADAARDWKELVALRRAEREQHMLLDAPDTILEGAEEAPPARAASGQTLTGIPLSSGYAEGPARLIRSPDDLKNVQRGDILVVSVIDPGMAPVLGLAAGLVVEMGGTLSHGAIIAREYGLPAVTNVQGAVYLLKAGEQVTVDASRGEVRQASAH